MLDLRRQRCVELRMELAPNTRETETGTVVLSHRVRPQFTLDAVYEMSDLRLLDAVEKAFFQRVELTNRVHCSFPSLDGGFADAVLKVLDVREISRVSATHWRVAFNGLLELPLGAYSPPGAGDYVDGLLVLRTASGRLRPFSDATASVEHSTTGLQEVVETGSGFSTLNFGRQWPEFETALDVGGGDVSTLIGDLIHVLDWGVGDAAVVDLGETMPIRFIGSPRIYYQFAEEGEVNSWYLDMRFAVDMGRFGAQAPTAYVAPVSGHYDFRVFLANASAPDAEIARLAAAAAVQRNRALMPSVVSDVLEDVRVLWDWGNAHAAGLVRRLLDWPGPTAHQFGIPTQVVVSPGSSRFPIWLGLNISGQAGLVRVSNFGGSGDLPFDDNRALLVRLTLADGRSHEALLDLSDDESGTPPDSPYDFTRANNAEAAALLDFLPDPVATTVPAVEETFDWTAAVADVEGLVGRQTGFILRSSTAHDYPRLGMTSDGILTTPIDGTFNRFQFSFAIGNLPNTWGWSDMLARSGLTGRGRGDIPQDETRSVIARLTAPNGEQFTVLLRLTDDLTNDDPDSPQADEPYRWEPTGDLFFDDHPTNISSDNLFALGTWLRSLPTDQYRPVQRLWDLDFALVENSAGWRQSGENVVREAAPESVTYDYAGIFPMRVDLALLRRSANWRREGDDIVRDVRRPVPVDDPRLYLAYSADCADLLDVNVSDWAQDQSGAWERVGEVTSGADGFLAYRTRREQTPAVIGGEALAMRCIGGGGIDGILSERAFLDGGHDAATRLPIPAYSGDRLLAVAVPDDALALPISAFDFADPRTDFYRVRTASVADVASSAVTVGGQPATEYRLGLDAQWTLGVAGTDYPLRVRRLAFNDAPQAHQVSLYVDAQGFLSLTALLAASSEEWRSALGGLLLLLRLTSASGRRIDYALPLGVMGFPAFDTSLATHGLRLDMDARPGNDLLYRGAGTPFVGQVLSAWTAAELAAGNSVSGDFGVAPRVAAAQGGSGWTPRLTDNSTDITRIDETTLMLGEDISVKVGDLALDQRTAYRRGDDVTIGSQLHRTWVTRRLQSGGVVSGRLLRIGATRPRVRSSVLFRV